MSVRYFRFKLQFSAKFEIWGFASTDLDEYFAFVRPFENGRNQTFLGAKL